MAWWKRILDSLFSERAAHANGLPDSVTAALAADSAPTATRTDGGFWWLPQPARPAHVQAEPPDAGEIHDQLHRALGVAIDDPELAVPVMPQMTDRALRML